MIVKLLGGSGLALVSSIAIAQSLVDAPSSAISIDRIQKMKEVVSDKFRDPASTLFRKIKPDEITGKILCGQVNSKNAYGGYAGFDNFIFNSTTNEVVIFDRDIAQTEAEREEDLAVFVLAGCAATAGITDRNEIERLRKLALKPAAASPRP